MLICFVGIWFKGLTILARIVFRVALGLLSYILVCLVLVGLRFHLKYLGFHVSARFWFRFRPILILVLINFLYLLDRHFEIEVALTTSHLFLSCLRRAPFTFLINDINSIIFRAVNIAMFIAVQLRGRQVNGHLAPRRFRINPLLIAGFLAIHAELLSVVHEVPTQFLHVIIDRQGLRLQEHFAEAQELLLFIHFQFGHFSTPERSTQSFGKHWLNFNGHEDVDVVLNLLEHVLLLV